MANQHTHEILTENSETAKTLGFATFTQYASITDWHLNVCPKCNQETPFTELVSGAGDDAKRLSIVNGISFECQHCFEEFSVVCTSVI